METRRRAQALVDHAASLPKRKRKKKRKRKLPRNSSRPSSVSWCCLRSTRARPRLLRTAWFHSGYMFLPRSWRLFELFLREAGACAVRAWKPGLSTHSWHLARTSSVHVAPEEHRKIGIFGSRLAFFYDSSYLTVNLFGSGNAVFSASWSNNGYMFLPVYVVVGTVSVYSAILVPQWYMLCVSHEVSCWLRCTSRCVPSWFSGPDARIMAGLDQRDGFAVTVHHGRAASWVVVQTCRKLWVFYSCSSCLVVYMPLLGTTSFAGAAVAVHRWSSTSRSWC